LIIVYHVIIGNLMGANVITIAIWAMIINFDNNVNLSIYVKGRTSAIRFLINNEDLNLYQFFICPIENWRF